MNSIIEVEKSYNLCPICGLPSGGTCVMCSSHHSFVYDSQGKLIWCNDLGYTVGFRETYSEFGNRLKADIAKHSEWNCKLL